MRLAAAFPGLGGQRAGMAEGLSAASREAAESFALARRVYGFDVEALFRRLGGHVVAQPRFASLAIPAHSLAAWAALQPLLRESGRSVEVLLEHSLGIWSAAGASGALSARETLRYAHHTASMIFDGPDIPPGTMAAVIGLGAEEAASLCERSPGRVYVAGVNSTMQVVLSGEAGGVAWACREAVRMGAHDVRPLGIEKPLHTPLTERMLNALERDLARTHVRDAEIPIRSHFSLDEVTRADVLRRELARQLGSCVRFADAARAAIAGGITHVVEVGPGDTLGKLIRWISRDVKVARLDTGADLAAVRSFLRDG